MKKKITTHGLSLEKVVDLLSIGTDIDTQPAETEANDTTRISELVEELTSLFNTAKSELAASLENTRVFPELSEPSGNGVAFEKFLGIYNALYETGTSEEQTPSLDVEA